MTGDGSLFGGYRLCLKECFDDVMEAAFELQET
jgi:hypothetical protein